MHNEIKRQTKVGHIRKYKGGGATRIVDRRGKWGNGNAMDKRNTREDVISAYFADLWGDRLLRSQLNELTEIETLLCHCAPKDCHGDVLAAFVDHGQDLPNKVFARNASLKKKDGGAWVCRVGICHAVDPDLYTVVAKTFELLKTKYIDA